jgi:predicted ferric reductase
VALVLFATAGFFVFYGFLCAAGEQEYCSRLKSEIMWTGYGISTLVVLIGGSSYYRHKIPYEVFNIAHNLIFFLYAVTIIHTFDTEQRSGSHQRYQTFQWVTASVLYYVCDRAAMRLNHSYRIRLVASSVVAGTDGSKMVILKLRKPVLFEFKPGQYAFLRLSDGIDHHWHPFSIASSPSSSCLEFYVEVFDETSWTGKLFQTLENRNGETEESSRRIDIDVMGPYGTSFAKTEDFSHGLAVGTGTGKSLGSGVVLLSLYARNSV